MQSEVARLNSLSLYPLPHQPTQLCLPHLQVSLVTSFGVQAAQLGLISSLCVGGIINDTVILRGIKSVDDILVTLMKTGTEDREVGE